MVRHTPDDQTHDGASACQLLLTISPIPKEARPNPTLELAPTTHATSYRVV